MPGPTARTDRPGRRVDLWWSGKHACHGGNIQVIAAPDGWPLWTSPVRPGREHDTTALRAHAERHAHVFVDCSRLKRLDFVAAGQLLNAVTGLRAAGRTLEFAEPSHLVAALLAVMGLHELATVALRRV